MTHDIDIARIAALVGEPARAAMLLALGDGRALPAGELAACAGVSAATASGHLGALRDAGLLEVKQQGRHRYYRLASAQVAALLESLMLVAAQSPARAASSRVDPLLQAGRTCYSHLAGRLGEAAGQFLCLLKGEVNRRMLCGAAACAHGDDVEAHVGSVVDFFLRAYAPR